MERRRGCPWFNGPPPWSPVELWGPADLGIVSKNLAVGVPPAQASKVQI